MPDINIEIVAQFDSGDLRDLAFRYLDHQGSVFEDEVPQDQRALWQLLQIDLPPADAVVKVGPEAIRIEYAPLDDELDEERQMILAEDVEDRIYEHLFRAGMAEAYVLMDFEGEYHCFLLTVAASEHPDRWYTERLYSDANYDGNPSSVWPQVLASASERDDEDLLTLMIELNQREQPDPR